MMPRLDGFAVCAELRRLANAVPVLMLTAKGQIDDRVTGLDAGADDYLVKPFSTEELLARVRALLRRVASGKPGRRPDSSSATCEIDFARQTAPGGKRPLSSDGQGIRHAAPDGGDARRAGFARTFSRRRLGLHRLSHHPHRGHPHCQSARQLETNPDSPRWIKTVHGVGYKLELLHDSQARRFKILQNHDN